MSFTGAGLALDILGAALLALGLFRHSVPLTPGWHRSPHDAANDRAFGSVGGSLLLLGFLGQLLGSAGLGAAGTRTTLLSAAVTSGVAVVVAYLLFALAYTLWFRAEIRWIRRRPYLAAMLPPAGWKRRSGRWGWVLFWQRERRREG